jgi:glycosyltransferase involved in cell wall biosynthesis
MGNKEFNQENRDLISIVLTSYNRKDFILEQLDSIVAQTYRDWELIIVDDCSTDGSEEIIQEFIRKNRDKKIIFVRNEKNVGVAKNFEKGLRLASGKYIAVCDSDDVWLGDKLERELQFLKSGNYGMVYSDLMVVDSSLKVIKKSFIRNCLSFFSNQKDDSFDELINDNHIVGPTILFDAKLKRKLIPFSEHAIQDFWITIVCSIFSTIGYLNEPTVLYRQHSSNMVGASKLSIYSLIFLKNQNFLENHLRLKRNSLAYLIDLNNVKGIKKKYRRMIIDKIDKTRILVECLARFKNNNYKCLAYLRSLRKLKAYREILQVLYFRFFRRYEL